jgi:hypothetical protein
MTIPPPPHWLILALLLIFVWMTVAYGESAEEWWRIATAIRAQEHRLDRGERKFIYDVVNRLAVDEKAKPTPEHQRWLLHLKQRLDIK